MIFGNDIEKGLVDCQSIEEFEQKLSHEVILSYFTNTFH